MTATITNLPVRCVHCSPVSKNTWKRSPLGVSVLLTDVSWPYRSVLSRLCVFYLSIPPPCLAVSPPCWIFLWRSAAVCCCPAQPGACRSTASSLLQIQNFTFVSSKMRYGVNKKINIVRKEKMSMVFRCEKVSRNSGVHKGWQGALCARVFFNFSLHRLIWPWCKFSLTGVRTAIRVLNVSLY